jgi:phage protein U
MYIKELPYPFLGMALANQEIQNNKEWNWTWCKQTQ